jgi:hydrogenase small subunit
MTSGDEGLYASLVHRGMSRRTFLRFASAMAATLALPASFAPRIAAAVTTAPRLPVIWLRGQACGGNTRAFLQASKPTTAELLLDLLAVDYHETIMARSGASAELARSQLMAAAPNGYLAVVEGAIPTGANGAFCTVGGRAFDDIVREVCAGALATIAVGSCAFDGGAPAARGGTTGAIGVGSVVSTARLVNLPGCPLNVDNLTATIVHYLTFKALPALDSRGRPLFAYGNLLHNQCERRAHFEFGEFVMAWGDEGSQKGWCLYKMGCKGPETYANCPTQRYADGTSWPVRGGHGCIGCTTAGFWDAMGPAYARLPAPLPFAPSITTDGLGIALVGGVAALAAVHGVASGARIRRWDVQERRAAQAAAAGVAAGVAVGMSEGEFPPAAPTPGDSTVPSAEAMPVTTPSEPAPEATAAPLPASAATIPAGSAPEAPTGDAAGEEPAP